MECKGLRCCRGSRVPGLCIWEGEAGMTKTSEFSEDELFASTVVCYLSRDAGEVGRVSGREGVPC